MIIADVVNIRNFKAGKMTDISFVIPAFNEEKFLPRTIQSIQNHVGDRYSYEIIIVDHGSTDRTVELARASGAVVHERTEAKTISDLRNFGVSQAQAPILVFLDADTSLTADWIRHFPDTYAAIQREPFVITGSKREIPDSASWVSRHWFKTDKTNVQPTHLGGGHIITTKLLFDKIGGFSPAMETGEDYEFCIRAKKSGASLTAQPALRALHYGVPGNLRQYFMREVWHGRGDWLSIDSFLSSKVAALSIIFLLLHVAFVGSLVLFTSYTLIWTTALLGIISLCLMSAFYQYRKQTIRVILANSVIYYAYYWARTVSLISVLIRRTAKKHTRRV